MASVYFLIIEPNVKLYSEQGNLSKGNYFIVLKKSTPLFRRCCLNRTGKSKDILLFSVLNWKKYFKKINIYCLLIKNYSHDLKLLIYFRYLRKILLTVWVRTRKKEFSEMYIRFVTDQLQRGKLKMFSPFQSSQVVNSLRMCVSNFVNTDAHTWHSENKRYQSNY